MKIFGFDMDGVIIDHTMPKILLAAKRGFILKPEQTVSSLLRNYIPEPVLHEIQHELYDDPNYALQSPMLDGALAGLSAVKKSGMPFYLISRRQNAVVAQQLLKKHGLWPLYFNEKNAFFVKDPIDKEIEARRLGVTHYVDDEIRILDVLASVKNKYLFDQHGIFSDTPDFSRVKTWEELLRKLLD